MSFLAVFLIISIANLALGYAAFFAVRHAIRAVGDLPAAQRWIPMLRGRGRE